MKVVLGVLIIICSSAVGFANPLNSSSHWRVISETLETATDATEFVSLQQKYPQLFQGISVSSFQSAYVDSVALVFDGPTKCEKGDSRLNFISVSSGFCDGEKAHPNCAEVYPSAPLESDPCGF